MKISQVVRGISNRTNRFSIRTSFTLLLLCFVIPLICLVSFGMLQRYETLEKMAEEGVLNLANAIADKQNSYLVHTLLTAKAVANAPFIQRMDWQECNRNLRNFHEQFGSFYANIHVANAAGRVVCSGVETPRDEYIGDRIGFQQAVSQRKVIVGDVIISRITGLPTVNVRYPVMNPYGEVIAVVTAQIARDKFIEMMAKVPSEAGAEIYLASSDGRVIYHSANSRESDPSSIAGTAIFNALRASPRSLIKIHDADGVFRLYGLLVIKNPQVDDLLVVVGVPLAGIVQAEKADIWLNVIVIMSVLLGGGILFWYGVDRLILSKIRRLVTTTGQIKSGDVRARTGITHGANEIGGIAAALDEMAEELEQVLGELKEKATRDPLTLLFNRGYFDEALLRELVTAKRRDWGLSVIMVDIDHLKRFNDTYGHQLGNEVLRVVAKTLGANVRPTDIVCRFGGEEFAIVMQDTSSAGAFQRAETLRKKIEEIKLSFEGRDIGTITASFGIAVFPDAGGDSVMLVQKADEALHEAKVGGRNKVVVW